MVVKPREPTLETLAAQHGGVIGRVATITTQSGIAVRTAICKHGLIFEQDGIAILLQAASVIDW